MNVNNSSSQFFGAFWTGSIASFSNNPSETRDSTKLNLAIHNFNPRLIALNPKSASTIPTNSKQLTELQAPQTPPWRRHTQRFPLQLIYREQESKIGPEKTPALLFPNLTSGSRSWGAQTGHPCQPWALAYLLSLAQV